MHQDVLRNAPGLLQSNTISTFKPTETHIKFKLNNLHQKWSFAWIILESLWIYLHLTFCLPNLFGCQLPWFWASNFPSCRRLWKQFSRWCRTATRRQKSNTRRSKSASSNGDWQEIMDYMHEFCWKFVPQTCYTGYETGAAIRFHGAHCYLQWFLKPMGIIPELPLHNISNLSDLEGMVWFINERSPTSTTNDRNQVFNYMFKEPSFVCMYVSAYDVYIYIYIPTYLQYIMIPRTCMYT